MVAPHLLRLTPQDAPWGQALAMAWLGHLDAMAGRWSRGYDQWTTAGQWNYEQGRQATLARTMEALGQGPGLELVAPSPTDTPGGNHAS